MSDARLLAAAAERARRWEALVATNGGPVFDECTVTKRVFGAKLKAEQHRTDAANRLGLQTGRFITPSVLASVGATMTVERIVDFVPIRDLLREDAQASIPIVRRVGGALGCIHTNMAQLCLAEGHFIHGDFNTVNVGVRASDEMITVLDWSLGSPFSDYKIADPFSFDVAHFCYSIIAHHSAPWRLIGIWERLVDSFLEGYASQRHVSVERRHVELEIERISRALLFRVPTARLTRVPAYVLLRLAAHVLILNSTTTKASHE